MVCGTYVWLTRTQEFYRISGSTVFISTAFRIRFAVNFHTLHPDAVVPLPFSSDFASGSPPSRGRLHSYSLLPPPLLLL